MTRISNPGSLPLLLVAALAGCTASIAGCGGGAATVKVTEPTAAPSAKATTSEEADKTAADGAVAFPGYVDSVVSESGLLMLLGWAAAPDLSAPAGKVTASVGRKEVAQAVPAIEREDVVEALGQPGLEYSGFELRLPMEALECGAPASGIEVTAEFDGRSGPIEFGEGVEAELSEAC